MKRCNSLLRYFYMLCFILVHFASAAQELDTISLQQVKSSYPITTQTTNLQFINHVRKWHYCHGVRNLYWPSFNTDTVRYYHANQIFSDGYTISYLEKAGNIRIEYILLRKHKDFWIQFAGLNLCYKTQLDDVKEYFKYGDDIISCETAPIMIGNKTKISPHYKIDFYTGENAPLKWHLFFNQRKQLIIIELDYDGYDAP